MEQTQKKRVVKKVNNQDSDQQSKKVVKKKQQTLVDQIQQIQQDDQLTIHTDQTASSTLKSLAYLLTLRLLEPQFNNNTIDIHNQFYDFHFEDDDINYEHNKQKLFDAVYFSKLIQVKDEDIFSRMKYLWEDILCQHPVLSRIFDKSKNFNIKGQSTFRKLFDQINKITLDKYNDDIIGSAYETILQQIMIGKVLGQFFTPTNIKKFIVKDLIKPLLFDNGQHETIFDPAMGTAGFLITSYKYLKKQSLEKNYPFDTNFIKNNIGGRDAEPDTYQQGISNLLIQSGLLFDNLQLGDSIRDPIQNKFDIILANPPFGIDGLNYNEIPNQNKSEYLPIKSNSAVPLFLQAIIYMLNINGRCGVVIPNGQELSNKSDKSLCFIREFLMKTCDLKEICLLPSKIFTHTSINTCILYFYKRKLGQDVVQCQINYTKTNKEKDRSYKFVDECQTSKVSFYDCSPQYPVKNLQKYNLNEHKKLLIEVDIDQIKNNNYSLNYQDYMKQDEIVYNNDEIQVKSLGEVCEFQNGQQLDKQDIIDGDYPVFGGGQKLVGYHNQYNRNGNEIIVCGTGNNCGYVNYNNYQKYWASQCFTYKTIDNSMLNNMYLYYYSKLVLQQKFMDLKKGTAQQYIRYTQVQQIKIPILSIDRQSEIVEYLDYIYDKCNKTSQDKINELKQLNQFCINNQKKYGQNQIKSLGEVCDINYGTRIVRNENIEGEYPVYGSGRQMFTTQTYNREGYNILIGRFALSQDCVRLVQEKLFLNDSGLTIKPKTQELDHKYLGYYMYNNQLNIYKISRGTAQKNLDIELFKQLKIVIPSIERQQEIVDYCDHNEKLIKQLEQEIENNKKMAKQYLQDVLQCNMNDQNYDEVIQEVQQDQVIQDVQKDQVQQEVQQEVQQDQVIQEVQQDVVIQEIQPQEVEQKKKVIKKRVVKKVSKKDDN